MITSHSELNVNPQLFPGDVVTPDKIEELIIWQRERLEGVRSALCMFRSGEHATVISVEFVSLKRLDVTQRRTLLLTDAGQLGYCHSPMLLRVV